MDGKERTMIVSFPDCIQEKSVKKVGRLGKAGAAAVGSGG